MNIKNDNNDKNNKNKIAIWGWWQGYNLGDLWIKESILKEFPEAEPINTNNLNFEQYKYLLIGGGGLLNGPKLCYPFNEIKTRYGTIGLGGEFEIEEKKELREFIEKSEFFGVRDNNNKKNFDENNEKIEISGDCSFLYPLRRIKQPKEIKNIKLIWRNPYGLLKWDCSNIYKNEGKKMNKMFEEHIGYIPNKNNEKCKLLYTKLLSKHGQVEQENYICRKFNFEMMYEMFENTNLVVSMRYHGIVAAIQLGIPCIAIDIYPKVRTLMKECNLEKYCIKINEYNKLEELIYDINKNKKDIIKKMYVYRIIKEKTIKNFCDKIKKIMINDNNKKIKINDNNE